MINSLIDAEKDLFNFFESFEKFLSCTHLYLVFLLELHPYLYLPLLQLHPLLHLVFLLC